MPAVANLSLPAQDCEISSLRNIVDGVQSMSVYKNTSDLVDVVHILSQAILAGDTIDASLCSRFNVDEAFNTDIYTNGTGALTSFPASPRVIDKNNLQFLVDVGLYKWDASHRYLEWR